MPRRRACSLPEVFSPSIGIRWLVTAAASSRISSEPEVQATALDVTSLSSAAENEESVPRIQSGESQATDFPGVGRQDRLDLHDEPSNTTDSQSGSSTVTGQHADFTHDNNRITRPLPSRTEINSNPTTLATPGPQSMVSGTSGEDTSNTDGNHHHHSWSETNSEVSGEPDLLRDKITLVSRLSLLPDPWSILLLASSASVTAFTVYYVWNASFNKIPSGRMLWASPEKTIFTVNFLSYLATVLVSGLVSDAYDQFRWIKGRRDKGIDFLSFLALSPSISVPGLCHLMLSPVPRINSKNFGHRLWSLQR